MDPFWADDDDADRRVIAPRSSPNGHPYRRPADGHRPPGEGLEAIRLSGGFGSVRVLKVVRVVRRVRVGGRARRVRAERLGEAQPRPIAK